MSTTEYPPLKKLKKNIGIQDNCPSKKYLGMLTIVSNHLMVFIKIMYIIL